MAIDSAEQTATALRTVTVPRFAPRLLTASTSPRRDTTSPYRLRTFGRLILPASVRSALGCGGRVTVKIKAGSRTLSTRTVSLSRTCRYSSRATVRRPRGSRARTLRVTARFGGNGVPDLEVREAGDRATDLAATRVARGG